MNTHQKKYVLVVQGEGRGHMTQAISLYELLLSQGHTVSAVILGSGGKRDIPQFFFDKVKVPIHQLISPNFSCDKNNKSIRITRTLIDNAMKLKTFRRSLQQMDAILKEHEPDVIINFFDLLLGLYYRFYKPKFKMVCIAHQYIYFHPDFEFPKGHFLDRLAIKLFTRLTAFGSSKNLALSFYKIYTHHNEVVVVPPLLRNEVFNLEVKTEDYFLVYLVNNGYFEEILNWHRLNPGREIHCFTDNPEGLSGKYTFNKEKLFIHRIDDKLFLEKMSKARGLASTAGFESVCEAMYLGKPVLMVPIQGHFEQFCNSRDAHKAGAGIYDKTFNLSRFELYCRTNDGNNQWFKNWVAAAQTKIINELTTV
ncbi:MAG: glycosyltransferase family protein [Sediminibacterium sp.]|nr:glycosyltransferase family protein [Sediminibacterium sp.]